MPRYMLDTNIVSHAMRREPAVLARLASVSADDCCISAVTRSELRYGVALHPGATRLARLVGAYLDTAETLPWAGAEADRHGQIRAALRLKGTPNGGFDEMIAAHALAAGCILVTANVRHFARVEGLTVEDWTQV